MNDEWTVLLYIGAVDNGQKGDDKSLLATLKDLPEKVGPRVRLAYQFATAKHTRRGAVVGGTLRETDPGPPIDITTSQPLTDFIDWGTSKFPGRYTALFLKDHGAGFEDPKLHNRLLSQGELHGRLHSHALFYDGKTGKFLPTSELRTAVANAEVGSVDVYGFDACSMSGVEVSYEVRDVARYVIGSETTESAVGWPYRDLFLELSKREGEIAPGEMALEVLKLANANKMFRLSVAATSFLEPLAKSLDTLARTLFREWGPAAEQGLEGVLRLGDPDYVDLGDLLRGITGLAEGGGPLSPEVRKHADEVLKELNEACMATRHSPRSLLSIFYPPSTGSEYLPTYGNVAFGRENAWALFLGLRFYWLLYSPSAKRRPS